MASANSEPAESQPLLGSESETGDRNRTTVSQSQISSMHTSFTFRALVAGMLIGILINLSNMYYGLIAGASQQMPIVSALLGYLAFKLMSKFGFTPLSKAENVLIVSTATATGCMPVTAGFAELIPALEYVLGPEDGGSIHLRWTEMFMWSLGVCFFGILFAALLRQRLVVPRNLPWPGATASANVIRALHIPKAKYEHRSESNGIENRQEDSRPPQPSTELNNGDRHRTPSVLDESPRGLQLILKAAAWSALLTILMYFVPILRNLPVFGRYAADDWLWTFTLSPGFFGGGMIMGPEITLHMLTGTIVGWAILSPYAKSQGWASGPVDDWTTGSRGWIVWISLSALIADALVKIGWICVQPAWNACVSTFMSQFAKQTINVRDRSNREESSWYPVAENGRDDHDSNQDHLPLDTRKKSYYSVTRYTLWFGFIASILVCVVTTSQVFGSNIPWYYVLLSVVLALPMGVISIRTLGESDYNPQSGLVSQLAFASITPRSSPGAVLVNIVSSAISTAGASQTGDLAYDFKIGHLVGAAPQVQMYGQVVGSIFGALVSCATYRLYTSRFAIPGPFLQIPASFLQISTAKLVLGRGLPDGAAEFTLGFGIFFMVATIVKMRYSDRWWQMFIPSGVPFAVGIFLLPSFTLSRTAGGLFTWLWILRAPSKKAAVEVIGSGLILGESIASLGDLVLSALNIPQLGPK